jgi:putative phage-type endonuclease
MIQNKIKKTPNINARDFATILGKNPYQTAFELLENKIEHKHLFLGNKFTDHGNKYESIAIKVFEDISGLKVNQTQITLKHPNYQWITGRVDGIIEVEKEYKKENNSRKRKRNSEKENIVIEIKCPLKDDRNEPLTIDNIPLSYWCQCQVYMNLINCDRSYYIEYYINPNNPLEYSGKLYYIEITRDNKWWNENIKKIQRYYKQVEKYSKNGSLEAHPIRKTERKWIKKILN